MYDNIQQRTDFIFDVLFTFHIFDQKVNYTVI